ncbi:MAG TPA: hypothetical protein VK929_08295 [Longimicrobiales bacterium]|nr:hypothetical protein [Longimicrobiales bacterium]
MRHTALLPLVVATLALVACDRASAPVRPAAMEPLHASVQEGTAGEAVAQAPAVRVTAEDGRAAPGVVVRFAVTTGEGAISAAQVETDVHGEARLGYWRLGERAGDNRVTAIVPGIEGNLTFHAMGLPGPAVRLAVIAEPGSVSASGVPITPQPVIALQDRFGNTSPEAGVRVVASADPSVATAQGDTATTGADGRAVFTALRLDGPAGEYTLHFAARDLAPAAAASDLHLVHEQPGICSGALPLAFGLGQTRRVTLDSPQGLACLEFDQARNAGQQYLVLLENMPMYGGFDGALFNAVRLGEQPSPRNFSYTLSSAPPGTSAVSPTMALQRATADAPAGHVWDFGEGPIYELRPDPPAGGLPELWIAGKDRTLGLASTVSAPVVGDTIHGIWMEALSHLGIPAGAQSAVVRFVSDELIIAEDVRLPELQRHGGGYNTPLHPDTLVAIGREYARHASRQSGELFAGTHNAAVSNVRGGRVVAVHSIMYASNIWGYTYSTSDYFVFDYWVGSQTQGSIGGLNQRVERVVDNLFMHEVAHMREAGLLQQAGLMHRRGNQWFVEGFARFSERLPIAARLLGNDDPSRTSNVVLPLNSAFNNAYFRDDVPTYLSMIDAAFSGYQNSSFVFDYLADMVALGGGDWREALREFAVAAGRPDVLDDVTLRRAGVRFPELFTRARIALYLDDIGTAGLPAWTQYHQYHLRQSRPPGTGTDPRNAFPRLVPGDTTALEGSIAAGAAAGFVIDGTAATSSGRYRIDGPATPNAVLSVTRIR